MWEAAAADVAGVGAVAPPVHALVQVEAAALAEALDAERLAGMGVAMHAQLSGLGAVLPAVQAAGAAVAAVGTLVPQQH